MQCLLGGEKTHQRTLRIPAVGWLLCGPRGQRATCAHVRLLKVVQWYQRVVVKRKTSWSSSWAMRFLSALVSSCQGHDVKQSESAAHGACASRRLAPIAFICNLVEYNMLAYRTLNVTGRWAARVPKGIVKLFE
eukprot:981222-Amphidinium_carterae.5